jgi:hypothetical protein
MRKTPKRTETKLVANAHLDQVVATLADLFSDNPALRLRIIQSKKLGITVSATLDPGKPPRSTSGQARLTKRASVHYHSTKRDLEGRVILAEAGRSVANLDLVQAKASRISAAIAKRAGAWSASNEVLLSALKEQNKRSPGTAFYWLDPAGAVVPRVDGGQIAKLLSAEPL